MSRRSAFIAASIVLALASSAAAQTAQNTLNIFTRLTEIYNWLRQAAGVDLPEPPAGQLGG